MTQELTLSEYAHEVGTTQTYLLKKICLAKKEGKEAELKGVMSRRKVGNNWLLTVDKKNLKKIK